MSKKFGINSKSADAKARKDAVKQANDRDKQQKLEDEYWRDDDKHVQKKQQRKNDQELKEQENLRRKQENQRLLEQEEAALNASKAKAKQDLAPKKVTQAQIQQRQGEAAAAIQIEKPKRTNLVEEEVEDTPIEENVNRLTIDGASARNVDDAIDVLQNSQTNMDRHPEKRMKAAYDAYEAENLPKLKQENPTLRLSQLKQVLKKEWMKAPENPFNKPTKTYNEGSISKQKSLPEQDDSDEDDH